MRVVAALITAMLSFNTAAMEKRVFASPAALVAGIPHAVIGVEAKGDLNADGRDDWAGFVQNVNLISEARGTTRQLYILLQTAAGSYVLAVQSAPEDLPERGTSENAFGEDMTIENGMLSFKDRNLWRGCSVSDVYKFRFYKNDWRLVGVTSTETNNNVDVSGRSQSIDLNLLTGAEEISLDERVTSRHKHKPRIFLLRDFNRYKDLFRRIGKTASVC